jgi:hypothetical protein
VARLSNLHISHELVASFGGEAYGQFSWMHVGLGATRSAGDQDIGYRRQLSGWAEQIDELRL